MSPKQIAIAALAPHVQAMITAAKADVPTLTKARRNVAGKVIAAEDQVDKICAAFVTKVGKLIGKTSDDVPSPKRPAAKSDKYGPGGF